MNDPTIAILLKSLNESRARRWERSRKIGPESHISRTRALCEQVSGCTGEGSKGILQGQAVGRAISWEDEWKVNQADQNQTFRPKQWLSWSVLTLLDQDLWSIAACSWPYLSWLFGSGRHWFQLQYNQQSTIRIVNRTWISIRVRKGARIRC